MMGLVSSLARHRWDVSSWCLCRCYVRPLSLSQLWFIVSTVTSDVKREQLKHETAPQAKAVWEKREDFAGLKRKFPSLLYSMPKKTKNYSTTEKIRISNLVEPTYVHSRCV